MHRTRAALAPLAIAATLAASAAGAKGQLQARPTMVEMPPAAAATRFILANTGDAPVAAQIKVFEWRQSKGQDELVPTRDVVVSPPIAQVAPGAEQVVRIIRPGPPVGGRDRSYRLVVEELPGSKKDANTAISVRLRYVIPLFLRAQGSSRPALACRLHGRMLACVNKGGQPAQLGRTTLHDSGGHAVELSAGLFGYVLPASERQWTLSDGRVDALSNTLRLESHLNGQPVTLPVARSP